MWKCVHVCMCAYVHLGGEVGGRGWKWVEVCGNVWKCVEVCGSVCMCACVRVCTWVGRLGGGGGSVWKCVEACGSEWKRVCMRACVHVCMCQGEVGVCALCMC